MKIRYFVLFFISYSVFIQAQTLSLDSLEQIPPSLFQDRVIRYERAMKMSEDTSQNPNIRAFALAADLYYLSDWENAYNAYIDLLGKDPALDRSITLRLARIRFNMNQPEEARKIITQGNSRYQKEKEWKRLSSLLCLEITLADTVLAPEQKADSIHAFLEHHPKEKNASELRYRRALFLEQAGQIKRAKQIYLKILTDSFEFGDSAFAALYRLRHHEIQAESVSEKISYANQICKRGDHADCISLTDTILHIQTSSTGAASFFELKKNLNEKTFTTLLENRANALRNEKRNSEAIEIYQILVDSIDAKPKWLQSLIRLLRTENRQKESQTIDSIFQEKHKFSAENANNLWVRGFEHEQNKRYAQAIKTYTTLDHPKFGKNQRREWAKFRIGFVYFIQEKYTEAEKVFSQAAQQPFTWSASASKMFLGKTHLKLGNDSLARTAFMDCIYDFPLGYYAHRSRELLIENNLSDTKSIPQLSYPILSEDSTLQWIRSKQKNISSKSIYNPELKQRVKNLLYFGFTEEAYALYEEARAQYGNRLDFLYEYGTLFLEAGETAQGYRIARTFQNNADRKIFINAPLNVLRFLYPLPYQEVVFQRAGDKIDPFFIYSVMRQESIFDFEIVSPAGARGLLQIMPATGINLAKKEKITAFTVNGLFNPYLNIRLGTRYLIDLLTQYNGDYMYALSNYNAGPGPAKRWQNAGKGKPWDIRAEEISYWETRDYVKRVLGNYTLYREIWENGN